MAEPMKIINNPSITTDVFEYDEVGRVSAIAGKPLAGEGGGTIEKSDLMWKPTVGSDGYVRWSLASSATQPADAYISGAQGPAGQDGTNGTNGISPTVSTSAIPGGNRVIFTYDNGETTATESIDVMSGASGTNGKDGEDGISLSATSTELDQQRKTQVQIGQVNGPVQTTFELPWGQNGVSPTVTVTNIPADPSDPNHKKGGTEITIIDATTTNKFSAWNGNDGTMAGAPDIEGKNGISAVLDGSTYEVGLSGEFYKAVTSVSSKLNESDFTTYTATTAPGTFQPIGDYLTTVATSGSIIGTGLATNKIGLVASAEQALNIAQQLTPPENAQGVNQWVWQNTTPSHPTTPSGWVNATEVMTDVIWNWMDSYLDDWISNGVGLSADWVGEEGYEKYTFGVDTTNMAANKQYAFTTTGWDEIDIPAAGGEYLPLSGGTVSGATYFSAANGQNMIAVASAATLIGASRQTSANFGINNNAIGTTWVGVNGDGSNRGFLKYINGGNVGDLNGQGVQVEFGGSNGGEMLLKTSTSDPNTTTKVVNVPQSGYNNMSAFDATNGPNYMLRKLSDGRFDIGACVINVTEVPTATEANTYYFVYDIV